MKRSFFGKSIPILGCAALLAGLCLPAQAQLTPSYKLSNLIAGTSGTDNHGDILVGDKFFSRWSYSTVGADMPAASSVFVQGVQIGGNFGLQFTSLWEAINGSDEIASLGYRVAVTDPTMYVGGVVLSGNPTVTGGNGQAIVSENVSDIVTHTSVVPSTIAIFDVASNGGTNHVKATSDAEFTTGPSSALHTLDVQKTVLMSSDVPATVASITHFEQTFIQRSIFAPEPTSLALLAGMAIPSLVVRLRRRQSARGILKKEVIAP